MAAVHAGCPHSSPWLMAEHLVSPGQHNSASSAHHRTTQERLEKRLDLLKQLTLHCTLGLNSPLRTSESFCRRLLHRWHLSLDESSQDGTPTPKKMEKAVDISSRRLPLPASQVILFDSQEPGIVVRCFP
eukprot:g32865.t1